MQLICNCVLRRIFSHCLTRFRECVADGGSVSGTPTYTRYIGGGTNNGSPCHQWGWRKEEFVADFLLIAFRTLNGGLTREQLAERGEARSLAYRLFFHHMVLGLPWNVSCSRIGLNRGDFFHLTYGVQAVLGLAFADTEPYSLFPLDEYFSPIVRSRSKVVEITAAAERLGRLCA